MMHLGIDGRELVAGVRTGIGRYLQEVLLAATARGWVCTLYGDQRTDVEGLPPHVRTRVMPQGWTQWWDQVSLPRQLVRDRVSVFLSPYYKGPVIAGCPVVLTIHDLFFIGYPGRPRPFYDVMMTGLGKLYASRAARIIADSDYSKQAIVERLAVAPSKVTVIPVAVGREFISQPLTPRIRETYRLRDPYVLYVGNFKPHKNLPRLLQAYAALPAALRARYQLVLAGGDGENRPAVERMARQLNIIDRIVLPGLIDDCDLPALYSGCSLFVLPSLCEGFGLPALEAMACGAPVAVANRTAIPEVVGGAGLLFDPEESASITAVLNHALSSEGVRNRLRREGQERAQAFGPARTSELVLALLEEACALRVAA